MAMGLGIILVGPLILGALPTGAYWTDADEEAFQKAATDLHAASYGGVHDHTQPHVHEAPSDRQGQDALEHARQEYQRQESRLKRSQSSRDWMVIGLRGLGALVAAGGVFLYVRLRQAGP